MSRQKQSGLLLDEGLIFEHGSPGRCGVDLPSGVAAAGCSDTASMPLTSASISCSSQHSSRAPWAPASGVIGCSAANPGRRATSSLASGLYFIVHEPSG